MELAGIILFLGRLDTITLELHFPNSIMKQYYSHGTIYGIILSENIMLPYVIYISYPFFLFLSRAF